MAANAAARAWSKHGIRDSAGARLERAHASFVTATIIPITTNTTIAICIQIQVGDIASTAYFDERCE
jgi:hypothetical protein